MREEPRVPTPTAAPKPALPLSTPGAARLSPPLPSPHTAASAGPAAARRPAVRALHGGGARLAFTVAVTLPGATSRPPPARPHTAPRVSSQRRRRVWAGKGGGAAAGNARLLLHLLLGGEPGAGRVGQMAVAAPRPSPGLPLGPPGHSTAQSGARLKFADSGEAETAFSKGRCSLA